LRAEGTADTVPVLYSGRYQGRTTLVAGIRGFWAWDFVVQTNEKEEAEHTPFSSTVLKLTRRALIAGMSDDFLVYPAQTPLSESRPADLVFALPASFDWTEPARVSLTITDTAGSTVLDTGLALSSVDAQHRFLFRSSSLPRGTYAYAGTLRYGGRRFTYTDTMRVQADRTELDIAGQNEQLLAHVARRMTPMDSTAGGDRTTASRFLADRLLHTDQTRTDRATVARTVRIEQSWLLLAAIFALLIAEWIIRRRIHLD
jgi:hypothetical protein